MKQHSKIEIQINNWRVENIKDSTFSQKSICNKNSQIYKYIVSSKIPRTNNIHRYHNRSRLGSKNLYYVFHHHHHSQKDRITDRKN
jgi:hypothetical protein